MAHLTRARRWAAAWLLLLTWPALALAPAGAAAAPAAALPDTIFALTAGGTLVRFASNTPSSVNLIGPISGLPSGVNLVAIDFRPATGELYGLGLHAASMSGRLYVIDPATGAASVIGTAPFYSLLNPAYDFDMDFNPGADRVRVIDQTGLNLRVNPITGALSAHDTDLHSDITVTQQYAGVAYAPNKPGLSASTAYVYEFLYDTVFMLGGPDGTPSANGGHLTKIGSAGVSTSQETIGLDISSGGVAYASLPISGHFGFYAINLATGAATFVGQISNGLTGIRDIAVAPRFSAYLPLVRK